MFCFWRLPVLSIGKFPHLPTHLATMYYGKIPTVIIMSVTGHKTEREFLGYIGIDNSTLSEQMYNYWEQLHSDPETATFELQNKTAN